MNAMNVYQFQRQFVIFHIFEKKNYHPSIFSTVLRSYLLSSELEGLNLNNSGKAPK